MTAPEAHLGGKTVAVTGAASGIGAACAQACAAAGAHTVLIDVDAEAVTRLATSLGGTPLVLDLSSVADVAAVNLDADVLIHGAGFQHVSPLETLPISTFETMMAVMLTAPFILSRSVLPGMYERQWGRIISISSIHGHRASPFKSAYVAAKHGLEGLSKTIAVEAGPQGVTANCISPGYVRTPLVERQIRDQALAHGIDESDVIENVMLTRSATKRLIDVEEVAALAVYLTTPVASMINGASLSIDGGWTAT